MTVVGHMSLSVRVRGMEKLRCKLGETKGGSLSDPRFRVPIGLLSHDRPGRSRVDGRLQRWQCDFSSTARMTLKPCSNQHATKGTAPIRKPDATTAFSVTRPASGGNTWDSRAITNYNNVYSIRGIPSATAFTGFMGLTDSSISSETDFSSGTTSKRTGIYFDAGGVMKAQCNGVLGSTLGTSFTTSGNVKVKYVQSTNSVEMTYGTTPLST